jgi:hypothetical protein
MDMLYLHLRLIQSALGQKAEAEPVDEFHRGRSQGRPAMSGHEVASFPGEMGPPLGRSHERASPFRAKFGLSASFATGRDAAHTVSGAPMPLVLPATTSRAQHVRFTDEVPRRPVLRQVCLGYKSHTKGRGHASEAGTAFPRPRLEGCQQRQSRGAPGRLPVHVCSERQNLRVPPGPFRFMGPVSHAMSKNVGRTPHGGFTRSKIGAGDGGCRRRWGSPGVGNRHAGKYREWTLLRQRGGSGGDATPLPALG